MLSTQDRDYRRIADHVQRSQERQDNGTAVPPLNATGIHPTEFKVLILPNKVEEKIGSLYVPESTKETEKFATIEGRIIAVSRLAFTYATAEEWGDAKPQPGNRVIFAKYAGVRHKAKDGQEYLLVNDKDCLAILADD